MKISGESPRYSLILILLSEICVCLSENILTQFITRDDAGLEREIISTQRHLTCILRVTCGCSLKRKLNTILEMVPQLRSPASHHQTTMIVTDAEVFLG